MRRGQLDSRLEALAAAAELADGRLDPEHVAAARRVVDRAGERLGLGLESTIVALAGPTGAGKSSLFNVLAGADVAAVGVRRPTTGAATAAVWGGDAAELLDWLDVPRRHHVGDGAMRGLVLVDLPDFDSVVLTHRLEAERLVELVDLLVWVVDPQKYADAALHDRYLRPLARHADAMIVALNQADTVDAAAAATIRADLAQLLGRDGLGRVDVLAVSAATGDGVDALRGRVAEAVRRRAAALARLSADVTAAADALAEECAPGARAAVGKRERERLRAALADAAGVPTVVAAVERAHRRRGALATGWPFVRWVRRFRPDPLRRLRLGDTPAPDVRTSLASPSAVQRERVAAASRQLAAGAASDLPPPWPNLLRSAATRREDQVPDRLDRAVAGARLHVSSPRWWRVAAFLQRVLALVTLAGALWLLALVLLGWLQLADVVPLPELYDVPVPTLLLLGGIAGGLVVAFLARLVNGFSAARRAKKARRSLEAEIEVVAQELFVDPVERELEVHRELCRLLATAARA